MPWAEPAALPAWLQAADVLLIPPSQAPLQRYRNCVLPMKLFAYLAAGRPILAPASPDTAELLKDQENALLVPPERPKAAAAALDRLLARAGSRDAAGRPGATAVERPHLGSPRREDFGFPRSTALRGSDPVQRSLYSKHGKTDQRGDDRRRPGADCRGQIADLSRHGEQSVSDEIEKAAPTGIEQAQPFRLRLRCQVGKRQSEQQHQNGRQRLGRRAVEPCREQALALADRYRKIERPPRCRRGQ